MGNFISGSHSQRSRFLGKLRNKYKDLENKETPEAEIMYKEIYKLDRELKEIDNSIGTMYRN